MNGRLVLAVLTLSVLTQAGCWPFIAYPPNASNRCKEWVRAAGAHARFSLQSQAVVQAFPSLEERLDYYMCINAAFRPQIYRGGIFNDDVPGAVQLVKVRLNQQNDGHDVLMLLSILLYIKHDGLAQDLFDDDLRKVVLEARDRTAKTKSLELTDVLIYRIFEK